MRHALAALSLATLAAAAPAAASPGSVSGSGRKVTQQRQVGDFTAIRAEGSLDVAVTVGTAGPVSVTIDDDLQPRVITRVEGDTLVIRMEGSVSYDGEGRVDVMTPTLRAFGLSGSGDVTIDGGSGDLRLAISGSGDVSWRGKADQLVTATSGSGDFTLRGTAAKVQVAVSGSGDVQAKELTAGSAEVSIAGSGDVEITLAGGTLSASVAGSGDVVWHGEATVTKAAVAGSGEVVRR